MVILILMMEAGNPENWHWLWGGRPPVGGDGQLEEDQIAGREIDSRLRLKSPNNSQALLGITSDSPPASPSVDPALAELDGDSSDCSRGVRGDLLAVVEDDRVLRSVEHDAWFHLLEILASTDQRQLQKQSTGRIGFVSLFEEPQNYRGKLVTVRGTVRRAYWVQARKNDYGIEGYFVCWLRPAGGPNSPMVVYSLQLPDQFPTGTDVAADASFTGFFFKRFAYVAQDGGRTAPLILAKNANWTLPVVPATDGTEFPKVSTIALVVVATAAFAVVFAMIVHAGSRRSRSSQEYSPRERVSGAQLSQLSKLPQRTGVLETMQQMEAESDADRD